MDVSRKVVSKFIFPGGFSKSVDLAGLNDCNRAVRSFHTQRAVFFQAVGHPIERFVGQRYAHIFAAKISRTSPPLLHDLYGTARTVQYIIEMSQERSEGSGEMIAGYVFVRYALDRCRRVSNFLWKIAVR